MKAKNSRGEKNSPIPPWDCLVDKLTLQIILEPHYDHIVEFLVIEVHIDGTKLLGIQESKANLNMYVSNQWQDISIVTLTLIDGIVQAG